MPVQPPDFTGFRQAYDRGYAQVQGRLRTSPDDPALHQAIREYRRIFGMLDAMTDEERSAPMEIIDSGRIRRIAKGAGARDQDVIRLLFNYENYCEMILREIWRQKRGL
jgi:signal recognition particle GTPase